MRSQPRSRRRPAMRAGLWTRAAPASPPLAAGAPGNARLEAGSADLYPPPAHPRAGATRRGATDRPLRAADHPLHREGAAGPGAEGPRLRAPRAREPGRLQALEPGDGAPAGADDRLGARLGLDAVPVAPRRALPEAPAPRRGSRRRRAAAPARGLGRRVLPLVLEPLARARAAAGRGGGRRAARAVAPRGRAARARLAAQRGHLGAARDGAAARRRRPLRRPGEPARLAAL